MMLNLFSNGFYATRKRADATEDRSFEPTLHVTTRNLGEPGGDPRARQRHRNRR